MRNMSALICAFFSLNIYSANFDDYTIDELKQPSIEVKQKWLGNVGPENVSSTGIEGTAKITWAKSAIETANGIASVDIKKSVGFSLNGACKNVITLTDSAARLEGRIDCEYHHDTTGSKGFLQYRYAANMVGIEEMPKCPPTNNTTHIIPVYDSFNKMWCAPQKKPDCPVGYYSKSLSHLVNPQNPNECQPRDCPSAGTSQSLARQIGHGDKFGMSGGYCVEGCSYNVSRSGADSNYARGTSTGQHCGPMADPNKFLGELQDENNCEQITNSDGVVWQKCNDGGNNNGEDPTTPPPDEQPSIKNDDKKVDEQTPDLKPKSNCVDDTLSGVACEVKNNQIELENQIGEQINNDNKLHNLKIDAETNSANAIVQAQEQQTSIIYSAAQNDAIAAEQLIDKLDKLINAVNNSKNDSGGGSGSGDGSGSGSGSGDGGGSGSGDGGGSGSGDGGGSGSGDGGGGNCDPADPLCGASLNTDKVDTALKEYFEKQEPLPDEIYDLFSKFSSYVQSNFAGFTGVCSPFTLDVSIRGEAKTINVNQHCGPYEVFVKPLIEWMLWVFTAISAMNIFHQTIYRMKI